MASDAVEKTENTKIRMWRTGDLAYLPSFPRMRESSVAKNFWIPACAGMTAEKNFVRICIALNRQMLELGLRLARAPYFVEQTQPFATFLAGVEVNAAFVTSRQTAHQ